MTGEDYSLSYLLGKEYHDAQAFSFKGSIMPIVNAISYQSREWNARLGEQLAIIFLAFPPLVYALINTIMSVLYFFFISYFSFEGKPNISHIHISIAIALSYACVILFMPVTGEIFFLRNTATNYLWAMNVIFIFILPYFMFHNRNGSARHPIIMIPVMLIIGFLAGMTNENTGIAVFLGIGIYILYAITHKKRLPIWSVTGFLGLSLGILYLLLSPSTQIRIRYYSSIFIKKDPTFFTYLRRTISVIKDFVISGSGILIFLFVSVFMYCVTVGLQDAKKLTKQLYMMVFSLISLAVLVLAPYHEIRSFLPAYTFLLVLSCRLISDTVSSAKPIVEKSYGVFSLSLLLVSFLFSGMVTQRYMYFHRECAELDKEIRKQVSEGNAIVSVRPFITQTTRYLNTRQKYLEWAWQYPAYYGAQKITFDRKK
jgi:hypothetical protein